MCCKTRSLAGHSSVAQQIRALYHHNQVLERCHLTGNVPWAAPVPSLGNPADVLSEYIFPFRVSHVVPRLLHHLVVCYFCAMCVVSSSDCCMLPLWSEPDPISVLICGRHLMCLLFLKRDDAMDVPVFVFVWIHFNFSHIFSVGIVAVPFRNVLHHTSIAVSPHPCQSFIHMPILGDIFFKLAFLFTRYTIWVTFRRSEKLL